ncbi:MAG TPA: protein kinase [Kofleriaceae bacterium]|jgi:tetratricopeptide (TPR) repeat protein
MAEHDDDALGTGPTMAPASSPPSSPGTDATVALTPAPPGVPTLPPLPIIAAGTYAPERELARGGMGRIVAAVDARLGRRVALKELIEPAGDQLGRFQREALITARLQHPGIVPVYEAGRWPTGEPFFAMKLVQGKPLDRVIAEAKTLEQRLALLPRVAAATDAMAYAHSQRVIHRDLKPANVLVGDFGETVVIDWGLAKSLDETSPSVDRAPAKKREHATPIDSDAATLTVVGAVMGTPAYMAPEQARGEPLDQRADVFALGAMLYHLLAGAPPYDARTATEVIAAAAAGRVQPLAERERAAPPDLVAIVARAMAPLPADRYTDAGELADELRRFLTGQLVSAHHYTAAQRVGRFVRRHRAAVTIGALATVLIAGGATFAVRRIVVARDAEEKAHRIADSRRKAAEQLIDRMLGDVRDRLSQIGRLDLLASMGGEIREYYQSLGPLGHLRADDMDRMAIAIDLVGLAQRESGDIDGAQRTWTDERGQLQTALDAQKVTAGGWLAERRMVAHLDFEIGTTLQQRGKLADAAAAYQLAERELKTLHDELAPGAPEERSILLTAADVHDHLGDLLRNDGKLEAALEDYTAAKQERERAATASGSRPSEEVLALSTSHVKIGSVHEARGETQAALDEYRAALRLREKLRAQAPDNVELEERAIEIESTLAELERSSGDDTAAITAYQEAVPLLEGLGHRDPSNTSWRRQRGNVLADWGFALLDTGNVSDALAQLSAAREVQQALVDRDPLSTTWRGDLARTLTRTGDAHAMAGDLDAALSDYRGALALRQTLADENPTSAPFRRAAAWSYSKVGGALVLQVQLAGKPLSSVPPEAIDDLRQARDTRQALVAGAPSQSLFKNELASSEVALGRVLAGAESRELIALGLSRAHELVAADSANTDFKETLVQALLATSDLLHAAGDDRGRADPLREALAVAEAGRMRAPQAVSWPGYLAEIHAGLAAVATARGDARAAAAERRAVHELLEPLAAAHRLPAVRKSLL